MSRQTIFITGAASGIGKATALYFHDKGWFVGATDVDREGLSILKSELDDDCFTAHLDVTSKEQFDQVINQFCDAAGDRLDILFNNAGIAVFGVLEDIPFQKVIDTVNVNLIGVLNGVHAAIPLLRKTENSLCFTTASSAANFGTPGLATYGATKSAVKSLTEALSVELSRFGSRAADVSPGIIDTPLWEATSYVKGESRPARNLAKLNVDRTDAVRTIAPVEVAQCVWDAYQSDRLHWYVPEEIGERRKAAALDPEKLRDELVEQRKG
jgi:NAD(P)-dependent dehydrogenase (short-subunit alcohol dehydrogenase family)